MNKSAKIKLIKKLIKSGNYNWEEAIRDAANRIADYPESLLWK